MSNVSSNGHCAAIQRNDDEVHQFLQKMYNHDFHETHIEKTAPFQNDLQAVKVWEDSVKMINGQYQLDLAWKEGHQTKFQLPDNSAMAFS
jgi:hypothetical protein